MRILRLRAVMLTALSMLSGCGGGEPSSQSLLPALSGARFVDRTLTGDELRQRLGELSAAPGAFVVNDSRRTLQLRQAGTLVVPLRLTGAERAVRFELRSRGEADPLKLALVDASGRRHELGAVAAPAAARVSLGAQPAGLYFLLIEAEALEGEVSLADLRLTPAPPPSTRPPLRAPAEAPHLVIVILDAARADHFGCYGYARPTTPLIDALAAESLVFRRAYSECPSTACSLPGLLTGTPFDADGLPGKRLATEVTTLAESLAAVGYHTVALSANPNNSIPRGLAQGFAHFEQMWRGASGSERRDPHRQTRRALELVAERPADRPLFLVVHYLPPHEPYQPPPRFDLFTDPSYAGPVTGARRVSRAMRARLLTLDDTDRAQMEALYDGNLRYGDDAVGELFAGLVEQRLMDDAVILVTADHGEAFFEHGVHGHNSTLFDEMLHVPFVLRLPPALRQVPIDQDQLVSLLDVAPTFRALAGADGSSWSPGLDLLSPQAEWQARDRVLFHLDMGQQLAARSRWFKAITHRQGGQRALYDLVADPGEQRDVLEERPEVFEGMTALLATHLEIVRRSSVDGGNVEYDAEDEQMLRALGYL